MIRLRRPGCSVITHELGPRHRDLVYCRVGDRLLVHGTWYVVTARTWLEPIPFRRGIELLIDLTLA